MTLSGARDARQLVVTGKYADGSRSRPDRRRRAQSRTGRRRSNCKTGSSCGRRRTARRRGRDRGRREGSPRSGDCGGMDKPHPVSFRHDVIAAPQRRRLQRRRLPRHAERQERLQALASRLRPAAGLPATHPRTVRPPHRQARSRAEPDAAEGASAACRTRAASASASAASRPR